jgi:hypothetical protein
MINDPAELPPDVRPGQSAELLKELHILTRDGRLNQDSRRKLKQVYHLYQFIEPLLAEVAQQHDPVLVDHGAGKSYLGFILYDLFCKPRQCGTIFGVETRAELVERSVALAAHLGFERMAFAAVSVDDAIGSPLLPAQVDLVTALHACNTATDDAIRFALDRKVSHIVLVPCCQAEVAATLRQRKAVALGASPLAELWRHPLHTREIGSHLTNVLRCLLLESHGYKVNVTELVGWEHSLKNELIIASRTGGRKASSRQRAEWLLRECGLESLAPRFLY